MNTASLHQNATRSSSPLFSSSNETVVVGNRNLTIDEVVSVARYGTQVRLTDNHDVLRGIQASCDYINNAIETGQPIYGVTSGFGGMANVAISREHATLLQNNLMWFLKSGSGRRLPLADVRAAMVLRINSHLHGASGIRFELHTSIYRLQPGNCIWHYVNLLDSHPRDPDLTSGMIMSNT